MVLKIGPGVKIRFAFSLQFLIDFRHFFGIELAFDPRFNWSDQPVWSGPVFKTWEASLFSLISLKKKNEKLKSASKNLKQLRGKLWVPLSSLRLVVLSLKECQVTFLLAT